ncbi:hypothetical protein QBC33DRAFT_550771 [Phialemonium atrogriseum]|uniref:Uncharacterized protein n=1 Tax=Phialemonium atrogriseum TaxID=1093897 RepID=A0AAJ0BU04_9PEZI|nr:uncharacterized protein QBC33DRAFT_550771 [Phialemonium atrogriseum]KAK1763027.1 hypothetical protein QBC33DRAFT_550771 [Phialemonium atrogriseum]
MGLLPLFRLLALAAIASKAAAEVVYGSDFGGYGAPFSGRVGPFDANSTEWLQAVDESNSTGLFHIPGYDVSKPFPGKPMDGWTFSVAAIDVPTGRERHIYSERMVGYSMTLRAPDKLIKANAAGTKAVSVDSSWGMCLYNWETPTFNNRSWYNNPGNKPLADDGSCVGFLSDECIAALEKAASTGYFIEDLPIGPYDSRLRCTDVKTPVECGETVGNVTGSPLRTFLGVPIQYLNGSVTQQDGWELTEDDYGVSTQNLTDMWDNFVLNYWPVMTAFVPMGDGSSVDSDPTPGFARMSCISPNGAGTGKAWSSTGTPANLGKSSGDGGKGGSKNGSGLARTLPGFTTWVAMALSVMFLGWI